MPWTQSRVAVTIVREMEAHRKRMGQQLLGLRKARGWNQEDAAHNVGVSVKTWRLWERGKTTPYDSNLRRIGTAFEIDPAVLLESKPVPLGLGESGTIAHEWADRIEAQLTGVVVKLDEVLERLGDRDEFDEAARAMLKQVEEFADEAERRRAKERGDEPPGEAAA